MKQMLTIDKVQFNIRTQALLNFTPITFFIKHKGKIKDKIEQKEYWNEDVYQRIGKITLITFVDEDNTLWEIKIANFPKAFERITLAMESNPNLIPENFNVLEVGLVNVNFHSVINWAHGKFVIPRKMSERSSNM